MVVLIFILVYLQLYVFVIWEMLDTISLEVIFYTIIANFFFLKK